MQYGLLYLPRNTHRFTVSAILDKGATYSLVSYKIAEKLPVTVQPMIPLTAILPKSKTLVATWAVKLDVLIDDFIYM